MSGTLERVRRKDPAMVKSGYERDPSDFYPTPSWCTECVLRNYDFPKHKLIDEPACGEGHISKVLLNNGFEVRSQDLNETGYGRSGIDFLKSTTDVDIIFTNPPYKRQNGVWLSDQFVKKGLEVTKKYEGIVAMFMRTDWGAAVTRKPLTQHPAFAMKLEMTKRPRWIENSTGSPRHNYAYWIWDWKTVGQDARIRFDQ